jgi:hypothetical protein
MDNESRAAFEAWHNEEFGWYNPDDIQWQKRLRTWNASHKRALEDALEICKGASCANQTASHCYHEIKELMK